MYRMQRMIYTGELWAGPEFFPGLPGQGGEGGSDESDSMGEPCGGLEPHPALQALLLAPDQLIEIVHGAPPYVVVIGVPHQAASGVRWVAEQAAVRDSDECAALPALVAFAALRERGIACKLVIAAHATDHDPNKVPECPYWERVFAEGPARVLVECHGSGATRRHDLELSSGRNVRADPLCFGALLGHALRRRYTLAVQMQPGELTALVLGGDGGIAAGRLELPALQTGSLVEAGRRSAAAFHLEAKPRFRQAEGGGNRLTPDGRALGEALARTLAAYLAI